MILAADKCSLFEASGIQKTHQDEHSELHIETQIRVDSAPPKPSLGGSLDLETIHDLFTLGVTDIRPARGTKSGVTSPVISSY